MNLLSVAARFMLVPYVSSCVCARVCGCVSECRRSLGLAVCYLCASTLLLALMDAGRLILRLYLTCFVRVPEGRPCVRPASSQLILLEAFGENK